MPLMALSLRDSTLILYSASSIDVFQSSLLQRLTHVVHVEAQDSGGELRALFAFARFARSRSVERLLRASCGHGHDAIVIRHDDVARRYERAGTDDGNVHRAQRCLDCAFGRDRLAPYR